MRVSWIASALGAMLLLCSTTSRAQETWDGPAPAHLAVVDGAATVDRSAGREDAISGLPLVPGDVVRTDRGRVDIMLPDASTVDVDEFSTFELQSPTLYRLSEGRLLLTVPSSGGDGATGRMVIDTPQASVEVLGPGQYRVAMDSTPSGLQTVLDVLQGSASLYNDRGTTLLRGGEQSIAGDSGPPTYARSMPRRVDALDEWSASVRQDDTGNRSAQYLPPDLRAYGSAMDQSGAWGYEAPYGYVWYPTVAPDWRPYYDGYWASMPAFGWTWIGGSRWAWPTHHYGRWGYARSRWYWIPGRRWAPAWVSWGGAAGYVSWAPLGYNNLPVFALSVSNGYGSGWGLGWTVVNRNYFGSLRWNVRSYSIRTPPQRSGFVLRASAPPPLRSPVGRWSAGSANVRTNAGSYSSRAPVYAGPRAAAPSRAPERPRTEYRRDSGSVRSTPPVDTRRTDRSRGSSSTGSAAPGAGRTGPRAVPRPESVAPPVRPSAPLGVQDAPRTNRTRPAYQDRSAPTAQGRSVQPAPRPAPPAAAPPAAPRAGYRSERAPSSAGAMPSGGGGRSTGPRAPSSSGSGGRAVPRVGASGGGQPRAAAPSSGGGGRAQGRRR